MCGKGGVTFIMLKVNNISKAFDDVQAVDNLSFSIKPGETMGLIGPNGSGKTTAFRMILDLLIPDNGNITWQGEKITEETFNYIGYLPEERGLYADMSIEDQIIYFAELRGKSKKEIKPQIDEWMERFKIVGKKKDKVKTLSKGNQQKVQLITTLIHEPDLIILDEPFSGLDPVNADLLMAAVKEASARGAAIIFSSHNMNNVAEISDHLLMLRYGKTRLQGTVPEIRESYGRIHVFVETDLEDSIFEQLTGVVQVKQQNNGMTKIYLEDEAVGQEIFDLVSKDGYVQTFSQQAPNLEEIFKWEAGRENE